MHASSMSKILGTKGDYTHLSMKVAIHMPGSRKLLCVELHAALAVSTPILTQPELCPGDIQPVVDGRSDFPAGSAANLPLRQGHEELAILTDDVGIHPLVWRGILRHKLSLV